MPNFSNTCRANPPACLLAQGADPIGMPAEEFRAYVKAELARWSKVVQASGAKVE